MAGWTRRVLSWSRACSRDRLSCCASSSARSSTSTRRFAFVLCCEERKNELFQTFQIDQVRVNQLFEQAKWQVLFEELDSTDDEAMMFAALHVSRFNNKQSVDGYNCSFKHNWRLINKNSKRTRAKPPTWSCYWTNSVRKATFLLLKNQWTLQKTRWKSLQLNVA